MKTYLKVCMFDFMLIVITFLVTAFVPLTDFKKVLEAIETAFIYSFVVYGIATNISLILIFWLLNTLFFIKKIRENINLFIFIQFFVFISLYAYSLNDTINKVCIYNFPENTNCYSLEIIKISIVGLELFHLLSVVIYLLLKAYVLNKKLINLKA